MEKDSAYKALGLLITELRQKAGFAQQSQLAKIINSTQQTVSRWELGVSRPRYNQMPLLAKALNAELGDLLIAAKYTPKLVVATFDQPFPIDALDPDSFQRFCLFFLQALYPDAQVNAYGGSGHTQEGLDVEAIFPNKSNHTFQCKRVEEFGPAKVHAAVQAHTKKAKKKTLLLTRMASPDARKAILQHVSWELWDKEDISRCIRQKLSKAEQIKLVDIFFRGQRLALLGETEPGPWQTAEEFFAPFMSGRGAFNHAWHLVGRAEETKNLIEGLSNSAIQIVTLIGAGGAGKSRVLKQTVEQFCSANKKALVRFLSPTAEVTPKDLEYLGDVEKVLIVDDAHDRTDLALLFQYAAAPQNKTTLLLSLRPYALDYIRTPASNFALTKDRIVEVKLAALKVEQATELASQVLKQYDGSKDAAKDIAELTFDCPLATVIGAQIVAKERIHLELVKNRDEFRFMLLGKFQDIIAGNIGKKNDDGAIKKLLRLLSLIQPFNPDDEAIAKIAEEIEGIRAPDTNRLIRLLIDAGVFFKRGGKYRISPDLLADYIIEENCIGSNGRSTGYAEQVFDAAGPAYISNILLNLGKLDWRLANGNPANSHLLDDVWKKLKPSYEYGDPYIEAIAAVAYYQASRTLDFVEQLMSEGKYLKNLPEIIKYCAYNLDQLPRACACLWELGKKDARELNPNPGHPIRVLSELAELQPRKPVIYNETIVDFVFSLLNQAEAWTHHYTPFDLLKGVLQTEGNTTTSTGRSVVFTPFLVSFDAVSALRSKVIDTAIKSLSHPTIKIGALAARFLHEGLTYPRGMFNNVITDDIRDVWTAEFVQTLEKIEGEIKSKKLDALILVQITRSVSWHAYHGIENTVNAAKKVLAAIPDTLEYRTIYTLIDGYGHFMRSGNYQDYQKEWSRHIKTLTADLFKAYPDEKELYDFLVKCLLHIEDNYKGQNSCPYVLYGDLVQASASFAKITLESVLKNPQEKTARFSHIALSKILHENHSEGLGFAHQFLKTDAINLHAAVGQAYHGFGVKEPHKKADFEILQQVLASSHEGVVQSAILSIWTIAKHDPRTAIELLKCVDLGISPRVADEVFGAFHDIPFQLLDAKDIDHFLDKLFPLGELEGHWVETFLANVSEYSAVRAAKFFMKRVEHAAKAQNWHYRPCNYGPYNHIPLRFRSSSEFIPLLREVSAWMKSFEGDDVLFRQRAGELFDAMFSPFDNELVGFLQTWIDTAQEHDIRLISHILSEAPNDLVFTNQPFIIRFLEKAKQLGGNSLERAIDALYRSAIGGIRSGVPGEPFPQDIQMKAEAEKMLTKIGRFSPAYDLYESLKRHAERGIQRSMQDREAFEDEE